MIAAPRAAPPRLARGTTRGALVAVAALLAYLLLRIQPVLSALYANSDTTSALTLAQFLDQRGSGAVVLGDYAWLEPLYALRWTRWLPAHRHRWEAAPFVAYAASVALVAWTVRKTVSSRVALLVALALAAHSPVVFGFVAAPNAHGHTLLYGALLSAFLATVTDVRGRAPARQALWVARLALAATPGAAGDQCCSRARCRASCWPCSPAGGSAQWTGAARFSRCGPSRDTS